MSKKKAVLNIEDLEKGAVLYTDGGVRPTNPGYGGYGIHGYIYHNEVELDKTPTGLSTHLITDDGYKLKTEIGNSKVVKPITYVNCVGYSGKPITNNVAELKALSYAIDLANDLNIKNLTILSDSKYVIDGTNIYLDKWKNNNFYKLDGKEVSNKDIWKEVDNNLTSLKNKNINYKLEWVEGHSNNLGNDISDNLATIGILHSKTNIPNDKYTVINNFVPSIKYWNLNYEKHPFLNIEKAYINTKKELNIPGQYYLGRPGNKDTEIEKELSMEGKKNTDSLICYVELKTPDPVLELVIKKQTDYYNNYSIICHVILYNLYKENIVKNILSYGNVCLSRIDESKLDLYYLESKKDPITRGLEPPRIASRTMLSISTLKGILHAWRNKDKNITETNITDFIYCLDEKNNLKLKDNITSETKDLNVNIYYDTDKVLNLNLYFKFDIPNKNIFKKIEKENPKVYVLTTTDNKKIVSYSVVIEADSGIGIWGTFCSNRIFIK